MSDKNNIVKLQGNVQNYQWGGFKYIPDLLKIENSTHQPYAEYWLGAHTNASATLDSGETLIYYIGQNKQLLGNQVQSQFGRLPFLLKVLDVREMLSIQVHPNKIAAEKAFEKENQLGISLTAAHRNYKDNNHKPELMLSLGEFWLLHGFKNPTLLKNQLSVIPEFAFMLPVFGKDNYRDLYQHLMTMDQAMVNSLLDPLLKRIIPLYDSGKLQKNDPDFWAARAATIFNTHGKTDRGIFSIYLFNIVNLKQGEAIFQNNGILHAYLEGQNIELMANSDNVLRGGLTSKHIDVPELLKHVDFRPTNPKIIKGKIVNKVERVFETTAVDFELSSIELKAASNYKVVCHSAEIFLIMNGDIEALAGNKSLVCSRGEAFVAFNETSLTLSAATDALVYRASVPIAIG